MKQNIKFLLALGGAKLVMLQNENRNSFYAKTEKIPLVKETNLKKIASLLQNS